jgi:uncharacterized SAM-binding protein YcdF (DUF218 family)
MKFLIHFMLNPLITAVFLAFCSFLLFKLSLEIMGQILWFIAGLWLFITVFSPLPSYLLERLENENEDTLIGLHKDEPLRILVFASGFTSDSTIKVNTQLGETMLQRVVEGVRLYRQFPGAKLILSGPCKLEGGCQSEVAKEVAVSLGVLAKDIELISDGQNTIEELEAFVVKFEKEDKVIAVSSARHLLRIKLIAKYLNLAVECSASDFQIKHQNGRSNGFEPGFSGLKYTKMYLHERVGMWYTHWYFRG